MKYTESTRNSGSKKFLSKQRDKKKGRLKELHEKKRDVSAHTVKSQARARENMIQLEGTVIESLPNAMFQVELDNKHQIVAHVAGKLMQNRIWILPGDKVNLELSPYDLTHGRIIWRESGRRGRG